MDLYIITGFTYYKKMKMKRLLSIVFVFIGLGCFAQMRSDVAQAQDVPALTESKTNGVYIFIMPDRSAEDIEKGAKYYTHYFTVSFDDDTDKATITLSENDERSRMVLSRFLIASGFRYVQVGEEKMEVSNFAGKFLR